MNPCKRFAKDLSRYVADNLPENKRKKLCDVEKKSFRDQVHPEGELDGAEK